MAKYILQNPDVLNLLKKTLKKFPEGYIHFENENEWKRIFFYDGKITSASSSCKSDYLGQYLMSFGAIDSKQFEDIYQSNFETKEDIDAIHHYTSPDVLKMLIHEKIINTIFLATRWPNGTYSVFCEKQVKYFDVDAELSLKDIKIGLKKRAEEFEKILETIPELGGRPNINYKALKEVEVSHQKEIILNYLVSGKTIDEILSILPAHNYLLFKSIHKLIEMGVLQKGSGVSLSRESIIVLVHNSISNKKSVTEVMDYSAVNIETENSQINTEDHKLRLEIDKYRKLHDEFPENPLYANLYEKAKSIFIVNFYSYKLSPFAALELISEIEKVSNVSEVDAGIYYELKKSDSAKLPVRDLIRLMRNRHEVDILVSIGKLMGSEVIKESEPETFPDAIKLKRNDCYEKLFKKKERNDLFEVNISKLTPLMLSVVTDSYPEDIAEEIDVDGSMKIIHDYKMTLLMLASMLGNYEAVEFLINNNAKIDKHNGNGVTPLMFALENKNSDIANLLLRKGADVNARDLRGNSVLMMAVSAELSNVVDYMIRLGVDVNYHNSHGQTALINALKLNNENIIVSLIAAGTNLSHKDERGKTPIDYADSVESTELVRKGAKHSKQLNKIKKEEVENQTRVQKKTVKKAQRRESSGIFSIIVFSLLVAATASVNIYILFFSGDRFEMSFQAKSAMEKLGKKYCSRFRECRSDVPENVLNECDLMGIEVVSEFFRFAQSCDEKLIKKCGSCIRTLKCESFNEVNIENYSDYCPECKDVCN